MRGKTARSDEAEDKAIVRRGIRMHENHEHGGKHTDLKALRKGGGVHGRSHGGRLDKRARGGRTKKGGTQINIIVKSGDKEKEQMAAQQGMAMGAKAAMGAPKPPMGPPPGAGAPPMPPPGAGPGGPPGMPLRPPMRRGGKITLKTGSGGGMARLQKNRQY